MSFPAFPVTHPRQSQGKPNKSPGAQAGGASISRIHPSVRPDITGHADIRNSSLLPVASSTSAPAPALFRTHQTTLPFIRRHYRLVTDDEGPRGPPARLMPVSATVPLRCNRGAGPWPHELRRTCPPPLRNQDRLRPQRADLLFMLSESSRHGDLLRN
jgi:hypothetical protein